jgi:hypothetical protein
MPSRIASGSLMIGFDHSAFPSQCAVGVTRSRCALASGQRWLDTRAGDGFPPRRKYFLLSREFPLVGFYNL